MKTYGEVELHFPREQWMLPTVLAARAREHGDKVFLQEGEGERRSWTYAEIEAASNSIGNALLGRGYERGERLAIMLKNCPEYVLAWFGATAAGVVEVAVNPEYKGWFLEHAINLTTPHGVVTSPELAPAFHGSRENLPERLEFFVVDDGGDVEATLAALRECGWGAERFEALLEGDTAPTGVEQRPHELGSIIPTSGTTGPSKGVMMSHSQLYLFAQQTVDVTRLGEDDVYQVALPLFHGNAQFMSVYPALIVGASTVLFERFSPSRFLSRVREWDVTVANFVGVMTDWVWRQTSELEDVENPLRCIISAPTPAQIAGRLREKLAIEAIVEVFGQTEICLPFMSPYGEPRPDGATGVLVDQFFEVMLVDPETDEEVAPGEMGELLVRPREPWTINSGYWGMPEATAEARRNVWFHTGDGLRRDEEGWFYFVDRIKDALRRRGENISSFEVEQAVLQHQQVEECAVVAVPAEFEGGEDEVMAVVVLEPGAELQPVVDWACERMPKFLTPRFWRPVEEMPKTPSERIQKVVLRKEGVTAETYDREAAAVGG